MSNDFSLESIIRTALCEDGMPDDESNIRRLRRGYERFVRSLGGSIDEFKDGRRFSFDEAEIPFQLVILKQINKGQGLISKYSDDKIPISSSDVHQLIQSIIDEEAKTNASDEALVQLLIYLNQKFQHTFFFFHENCHTLIDALAANMSDLPSSCKAFYLSKVEHVLKKELALRLAEQAFNMLKISEIVASSHDEDSPETHPYVEEDPELQREYIERDKAILLMIQEDGDLRQYIESKIGKSAEEIYNYAALDNR